MSLRMRRPSLERACELTHTHTQTCRWQHCEVERKQGTRRRLRDLSVLHFFVPLPPFLREGKSTIICALWCALLFPSHVGHRRTEVLLLLLLCMLLSLSLSLSICPYRPHKHRSPSFILRFLVFFYAHTEVCVCLCRGAVLRIDWRACLWGWCPQLFCVSSTKRYRWLRSRHCGVLPAIHSIAQYEDGRLVYRLCDLLLTRACVQ